MTGVALTRTELICLAQDLRRLRDSLPPGMTEHTEPIEAVIAYLNSRTRSAVG